LKMAEFLDALTFTGSSIFEFIGPQAITMAEAAKIIGKAIKKPDLKYKKLSYEEAEKEMRSSGMTHQISKLMIEMYRAMNEGKMMPTKPMTAKHKGKITFEELSKTFSHMVHSAKKAA